MTTESLAQRSRSMIERSKSLKEIDDQYSRIANRLYRRYLDYEIELDEYDRTKQRLNDIYDRYQTNILRTRVPGWQRGMAYPRPFNEYRKPIPRSVYAKK